MRIKLSGGLILTLILLFAITIGILTPILIKQLADYNFYLMLFIVGVVTLFAFVWVEFQTKSGQKIS